MAPTSHKLYEHGNVLVTTPITTPEWVQTGRSERNQTPLSALRQPRDRYCGQLAPLLRSPILLALFFVAALFPSESLAIHLDPVEKIVGTEVELTFTDPLANSQRVYWVQRASASNGPWSDIANCFDFVCIDPTLPPTAGPFYYRIRALEFHWNGFDFTITGPWYSNTEDLISWSFAQLPEEQSDGRVRFNWLDQSDDEDTFNIQRKPAGGSWVVIASVPGTPNETTARPFEFVEPAPLPAGEYVYRVETVRDTPAMSSYSNQVTIDLDFDGDGQRNLEDNCALANPAQSDADGDGIGDLCEGPDTYDDFVEVSDAADLKSKIESAATLDADVLLYLPRGDYLVDNPVVIDRTARLVVQGENMMLTRIGRTNCDQPLFVVAAAGYINFANVSLKGGDKTPCVSSTNHESLNGRGILAQNTSPIHLEFQDMLVRTLMVELQGPGTFRTQNAIFDAYDSYWNDNVSLGVVAYVDHMIVLDHPGADFFAYGGAAVAGGTGTAVLDPAEFSAVLQRQGRVRTFMFQTSGYGAAQFHLETPSTLGAHHVAAGRNETSASEYDKEEGACDPALVESTVLVRVPPGRDRVDLAVKGHGTALDNTRRYCGFTMRLVDYSAAGRLWLVANADNGSLDHLATGNAPSALVLASGNYTYGNDILPIVAESVATSANLFNHNLYLNGGLPDYPLPQPRLVDETASFSDCAQPSCAIAEIPEFVIPMPVDRPRMNTKLPGMLDVTAPPYNAKGDGETDDTVAIQAAFDDAAIGDEGPDSLSGKAIYFPAGTYKISDPLYYVHREAPVQPSDLKFGWGELGGWIAGAGSEETFIVQEEDESVFATEGARFMSFQGITYRATPYTPDGPIEGVPNVSLDNDEEVGGPTNTLYFYDSHFDGGDSAVGIVPVIDHNIMGSEMTFVNSKFSNARTGVYIPDTGNNAMLDGGYNVEFSNLVESAIDTGNGSFYLTHATISGIGEKVIDAGGGYPYQYLYGVTMDAPAFLDFDSVIEFVIIENSVFTTTSPNVDMFKLNGGGGIIFLHSEFAGFANSGGDTLTVDNINRMGYGVNLFSDLPGWDSHSLSRWKIDSVISATQSGNSAPGVPTLGPAGGALLAALLARMATGRLRRR